MPSSAPSVIVFDVNETLSDMSAMGARFVDVGASATMAPLWFTSVLRDGFALTLVGDNPPFAGVARELLLTQLAEASLNRPLEDAAQHVMDGFAALGLHADVTRGVEDLHVAGLRLVTLSNGSVSVADRLLTDGGVRDRFELLLSVQDAGAWKPSPQAYAYAAEQCGVAPDELLLVACHPWDVDGARRGRSAGGLGEPLGGLLPRGVRRSDVHRGGGRRVGRALGVIPRGGGLEVTRPRRCASLDALPTSPSEAMVNPTCPQHAIWPRSSGHPIGSDCC